MIKLINEQAVIDAIYDIECLKFRIDLEKAIKEIPSIKLTNSEWIDFLTWQFNISRTSAKEMLHAMMSVKKEDNFKKQFSGRRSE